MAAGLSPSQRHLLSAIALGQRLMDHRDLDGRKRYLLHTPDGASAPVTEADVRVLVAQGLIDSNKKFPAATYWLTDAGRAATDGR